MRRISRISFAIVTIGSWAALSAAPVIAWAQQSPSQPSSAVPAGIPADVTDKLARDLAALQAKIQTIQATQELAEKILSVKQLLVTSDNAKVLNGADADASKEFSAKKGDIFSVLDRANNFYAVAADNGKTGWITAGSVKPIARLVKVNDTSYPATPSAQENSGMTERIFKALTEQAVQFRDSYKDNQYMYVSGFTVHVGIPPSVDLAFTFR
jgi:hypothetical protein